MYIHHTHHLVRDALACNVTDEFLLVDLRCSDEVKIMVECLKKIFGAPSVLVSRSRKWCLPTSSSIMLNLLLNVRS